VLRKIQSLQAVRFGSYGVLLGSIFYEAYRFPGTILGGLSFTHDWGLAIVLLVSSVVLHEMGHAFFAWKNNGKIKNFNLLPTGAHVGLEGEETWTWGMLRQCVWGGPMVNIALAILSAVFLGWHSFTMGAWDPLVLHFLRMMFEVNALLIVAVMGMRLSSDGWLIAMTFFAEFIGLKNASPWKEFHLDLWPTFFLPQAQPRPSLVSRAA
jgi:Zn-dependent protease